MAMHLRSHEKLCVRSQNVYVPPRNFAFTRKEHNIFASERSFCKRTQNLSGERKHFEKERKVSRGNAKHLPNNFSSL